MMALAQRRRRDEMTPRTEEAGHYGADGCPGKFRDLAVRQAAHIAEHECFAVAWRQHCNRGLEQRLLFINSSARRPRRSRRVGSAAPEGGVYCCFAQGLSTETGTSLPEAME